MGRMLDLSKKMDKATEVALRASGLTAWTDSARNAFRLTFLDELTKHATSGGKGTAWDKLPAKTREAMERYGIEPENWDLYKETPI